MTTTDGAGGASADAVPALSAAVDALLAAPWWQCSDGAVQARVVELERQAARLEAARLRLLAEAHERRAGDGPGAVSTAAWLAAEAGMRPERAAERVALAEALGGPLAVTGAALAAGDLSLDHAGVVRRVMTGLDPRVDAEARAGAERLLVEQAAALDPGQLAKAGRHLRARLREDADQRLARDEDVAVVRSEVRCTQDDDGLWHLTGTLDPVAGAQVAAALDALSAPLPAGGGAPDRRSAAQRRAAALVQLADAWLAGQAGSAASRPRLVVTVPAATVLDPAQPGAAPDTLTGGHPASVATVQQLACDAEVVPVLIGADGAPLDVGRTVYAFPDRIRTAVLVRDGGCTFPGCGRPTSWCQVHHLVAYGAGGATSERNGTALCGFHHRLVHRRGWRGELVVAQVVWHPPDRAAPLVPPPPWAPALERLVERWRARAG